MKSAITLYSTTPRPTPVTGIKVTSLNQFNWLSTPEQQMVMQACIEAGNNIQSIHITIFESHSTIEFTDWDEVNCGATLFHRLGGVNAMRLIEAQLESTSANMRRDFTNKIFCWDAKAIAQAEEYLTCYWDLILHAIDKLDDGAFTLSQAVDYFCDKVGFQFDPQAKVYIELTIEGSWLGYSYHSNTATWT